jgi:hypothetical protein
LTPLEATAAPIHCPATPYPDRGRYTRNTATGETCNRTGLRLPLSPASSRLPRSGKRDRRVFPISRRHQASLQHIPHDDLDDGAEGTFQPGRYPRWSRTTIQYRNQRIQSPSTVMFASVVRKSTCPRLLDNHGRARRKRCKRHWRSMRLRHRCRVRRCPCFSKDWILRRVREGKSRPH